VTVSL